MTVRVVDWIFWENEAGVTNPPELPFLPSRTKRRMSLISQIALHLGHSLMKNNKINDVIFASRYGEITRQLSITDKILEDGEVSPAAFSYSVFNTPVAILSLTEGLTGLTRAVYSGERSFIHGLLQSLVVLESGTINQLLFIMADEPASGYFRELSVESQQPLAIGMTLSTQMDSTETVTLSLQGENILKTYGENHNENLRNLHKWFKSDTATPFALRGEGFSIEFRRSNTE